MGFYFQKKNVFAICLNQLDQTAFKHPMKTNQIIRIAAAVVCCWNMTSLADDEADHTALRMIRTNYVEAVNTGDLSKIKNDLSKEVTGVMVTGKSVEGYDGLVSYWKDVQDLIGAGGTYHVAVNVDKTDLFGDVAVSRGTTEEGVRLASGKELDFNSFWTAVCHRENGTWKVVRMEATMNPIDNVFVTLQLKRAKLIYGIIGFIVGAFLVLGIRFLLCKRS
jgi:ketosteroid isomerase-like protein